MRPLKTCLLATALVAATASPSFADDGLLGTLVGAGLGGFIGSNIGHGTGRLVATGAGVFLGGLIGNGLTRGYGYGGYYAPAYYAPAPVYYAPTPVYYAPAPVYYAPARVSYAAPPVVPSRGYDTSYCREGTWEGVIAGAYQQVYGTACRQPDGSWHITP